MKLFSISLNKNYSFSEKYIICEPVEFNSNDNLFENFSSFEIFFYSKNKIKPPSPAPKIFAPSAPFLNLNL